MTHIQIINGYTSQTVDAVMDYLLTINVGNPSINAKTASPCPKPAEGLEILLLKGNVFTDKKWQL